MKSIIGNSEEMGWAEEAPEAWVVEETLLGSYASLSNRKTNLLHSFYSSGIVLTSSANSSCDSSLPKKYTRELKLLLKH